MASRFQRDQFGLFHAAVLHPRDPRAIQVMVFESDGGWWAYVDGERMDTTFRSKRQAQKAAKKAVAALPATLIRGADRPSTPPRTVPRPHRVSKSPRLRNGGMAGTALYAIALVLACGAGVFAIGAFDNASNLSASTTTHVSEYETVSALAAPHDVDDFSPLALMLDSDAPPLPTLKKQAIIQPSLLSVRTVSRGVKKHKPKLRKRWVKRKKNNVAVWGKDIPMPSRD